MGRYVPPDLEGKASFNQASGKGHALGARARKLKSEGILTVRFECPFAIWCTHCDPEQIIGQGVRFNAEKKKVGNYYSTPIWSFRFKHTVCGGWIEVRTDPQNAEYVVVEGGRRRDTGVDKLRDGEILIRGATEEEKERLEKEGGFGALEKKVEDKRAFMTQQQRVDELVKASEKDWADPYEVSKKLRREFRVGRRKRQADERSGEALKKRYGFEIEMSGEHEDDKERAKLIDFGRAEDTSASSRPLFDTVTTDNKSSRFIERGKRGHDSNSVRAITRNKTALQLQLRNKTRASHDPFVEHRVLWEPKLKRKHEEPKELIEESAKFEQTTAALVSYDSDSP